MSHPEQLQLVLPNKTISYLNLGYTPFHWSSSDKFPEYGGFTIQEPWEGHKHKKWYAADRQPYDQLQKLLIPYHEQWIEADCVAALVPDASGQIYSFMVNGVTLSSNLYESPKLHKLILQRKMLLLVTTCKARISGGGTMPDGRKRGYGIAFDVREFKELDVIERQRKQEKSQLLKVFVFPIIADLAKKKFFELFGNCCFKCSSQDSLVIDHHIPIVLGGRLVPGNLVSLCEKCNNRKSDTIPEVFYSKQELDKLQPILAMQNEIFSFVFNWKKWEMDREAYLLSLGVDANLIHEVLNKPEHRFYIPSRSERSGS
ncbi:MAG: HNH endonuclease signature motif containing protein [Candidatus Methylumidiphilus sp.]